MCRPTEGMDLFDPSWEVMDLFVIPPLGTGSLIYMLGEGLTVKEIFLFSKFKHNQWICGVYFI